MKRIIRNGYCDLIEFEDHRYSSYSPYGILLSFNDWLSRPSESNCLPFFGYSPGTDTTYIAIQNACGERCSPATIDKMVSSAHQYYDPLVDEHLEQPSGLAAVIDPSLELSDILGSDEISQHSSIDERECLGDCEQINLPMKEDLSSSADEFCDYFYGQFVSASIGTLSFCLTNNFFISLSSAAVSFYAFSSVTNSEGKTFCNLLGDYNEQKAHERDEHQYNEPESHASKLDNDVSVSLCRAASVGVPFVVDAVVGAFSVPGVGLAAGILSILVPLSEFGIAPYAGPTICEKIFDNTEQNEVLGSDSNSQELEL